METFWGLTTVLPVTVPRTFAAVGLGVRTNVFVGLLVFWMVAVPLARTLPLNVPVWVAATGSLAIRVSVGPLAIVTVWPPVMVVGLTLKVPVAVVKVAPVFSVIFPAPIVSIVDVGRVENDPVRDAATGSLAVRVRVVEVL